MTYLKCRYHQQAVYVRVGYDGLDAILMHRKASKIHCYTMIHRRQFGQCPLSLYD